MGIHAIPIVVFIAPEDIKMEKINEIHIKTRDDADSLSWIQLYMKKYPTEKGFRIEFFLSPKFIRASVYKIGGIII